MKELIWSGSDPTFASELYEEFKSELQRAARVLESGAGIFALASAVVLGTPHTTASQAFTVYPLRSAHDASTVSSRSPLDDLLAVLEQGKLPPVRGGLRGRIRAALEAGPVDMTDEWAQRLGHDIAAAAARDTDET